MRYTVYSKKRMGGKEKGSGFHFRFFFSFSANWLCISFFLVVLCVFLRSTIDLTMKMYNLELSCALVRE